MKIDVWLYLNGITKQEFAKMIGKSPNLVHKYMHEEIKPGYATMKAIYIATNGLVDANSFYDLSEQLIREALEKKKKLEPKINFRY